MIAELLRQGVSQAQIAKIFKVNRNTVGKFIRDHQLLTAVAGNPD